MTTESQPGAKINMNQKPPAREGDPSERCGICGTPFDDYVHLNCGGDCLECMAMVGDPDLIPLIKPLWQAEALERLRDDLVGKCSEEVIAEINGEVARLRQR